MTHDAGQLVKRRLGRRGGLEKELVEPRNPFGLGLRKTLDLVRLLNCRFADFSNDSARVVVGLDSLSDGAGDLLLLWQCVGELRLHLVSRVRLGCLFGDADRRYRLFLLFLVATFDEIFIHKSASADGHSG